MKKITFYITLILIAVTVYLYSVPLAGLPPVGTFFHPAYGFWANAETGRLTGDVEFMAEGLLSDVDIYFDERNVPHIFADDEQSLYFAQGFVTARDRLFQMELQVRAAGGQLAEWLGSDLIEYDRGQRRLGMVFGAEQSTEEMLQDGTVAPVIMAYTAGVNAYINSLSHEKYPLEYKLLNVEPRQWEPLHTGLLLKYMTQMLAGRSEDFTTSNTLAHFGQEFVDNYLSEPSQLLDPIIPPETEWNFEPDEITPPDSLFRPTYTEPIEHWQPDPLNGSNNWVASGEKTRGGYPILSNDMHLNMSLPAIWYEIQLNAPGINVYGVSIPGTPTVIVGFNEHMAWGSTNTGADVMDWYEITFRDENKEEYLFEGNWLPVEKRNEIIHVKGGRNVEETVLYTHIGPVYQANAQTPINETVQQNHALRWIAHEPSNELLTFYKLNEGENYADFKDAFSTFTAPAQNMNYADTGGNIAMQTAGKFPVKWPHQGRTVGDGADSRYMWQGFVPYAQNPYSLNPERGFLSAANQNPVGERYPYYLGDAFAPFERGRRINDLLSLMDNITVEDFTHLLMDNFSYHANVILPEMLQRTEQGILDAAQISWLERLQNWNLENRGSLAEPSVFHEWWRQLYNGIWDNKYDTEFPMRYPARDKTVDLMLNEPDSPLFDDVSTAKKETLDDLVTAAFLRALRAMENQYGEDEENWKWGYVNNTHLQHIGQIPGLGMPDVFTDGGAESVNAIRGSHGPSWRMIVELDPEGVRGYGVYPGGQTGNPGSPAYNEFVETWRAGELYELQFLRNRPSSDEPYPVRLRLRTPD